MELKNLKHKICELAEDNKRNRKNIKLEKEVSDAINFIDAIEDAPVRRALKLKYIDGLTWLDVGLRMGYTSVDGVKKLVSRYLNK